MQNRWDSIQCLRAVAAGLVFVGHMLLSTGAAFPKPEALAFVIKYVTSPLCHGGVDLFFTISGAIMYLVTRNRQGGPAQAAEFIKRRALRIYPLFWAVMLLNFAILSMKPNFPLPLAISWEQMALIDNTGLLAVAWTLTYEIRFYLLVGIALILLPGDNDRRFLAIAVAIVALFALLPDSDPFGKPLMLEFVFGAGVGALASRTSRFAGASFALGLAGVVAALSLIDPAQITGLRVYAFGIPSAFILYGAMGLERNGLRFPAWLTKAGDASYSTYLWHFPLISLLLLFWPRGTWPALIGYYLALTAGIIVVSILSYRWIEMPAMQWASRKSLKPMTQIR